MASNFTFVATNPAEELVDCVVEELVNVGEELVDVREELDVVCAETGPLVIAIVPVLDDDTYTSVLVAFDPDEVIAALPTPRVV